MLTFDARTGRLTRQDGSLLGIGYSGHGEGKNNPALQDVHDVGPIPVGVWKFHGPPFKHEHAGGDVLRILPEPGTDARTRDGFLLHGDFRDPTKRGTASHGCLIFPDAIRLAVWNEGDHLLRVIDSAAPLVDVACVPSH